MPTPTKPIPVLTQKQQDRFWSKVKIKEPDECWEWTGSKNKKGYGSVTINGTSFRSHRVALSMSGGKLDDSNSHALHNCDFPSCVNPSHLRAGTNAENNAEMHAKGRYVVMKGDRHGAHLHPETRPRGEQNGRAKVTAEMVVEIRERYSSGGVFMHQLASEFSLYKATVCAIIHRKIWKHIP